MSIPDPLTVHATPTDFVVAKISSPAGSSVFRKELDDGSVLKISFFQNGNLKRARHLARMDYAAPINSAGIVNTASITLSIDEPANGAVTDANLLYFTKTMLFGTLTDDIVGKMLNQEL